MMRIMSIKNTVVPLNPYDDGTCRTIKSQYFKNSFANFFRWGGYGATGVIVIEDVQTEHKAPERVSKEQSK